jgi:hypothetical protein
MTWEIYAIIIISIVWVLHKAILMGLERINELKQMFIEQGTPLVIDGGWTKGDTVEINYTNASEELITGFLVEIGIQNKLTSELEIIEQFIDIAFKPIKPYKARGVQLQVGNLDIDNKFISTITFKKVVFENGKIWERK